MAGACRRRGAADPTTRTPSKAAKASAAADGIGRDDGPAPRTDWRNASTRAVARQLASQAGTLTWRTCCAVDDLPVPSMPIGSIGPSPYAMGVMRSVEPANCEFDVPAGSVVAVGAVDPCGAAELARPVDSTIAVARSPIHAATIRRRLTRRCCRASCPRAGRVDASRRLTKTMRPLPSPPAPSVPAARLDRNGEAKRFTGSSPHLQGEFRAAVLEPRAAT